MALSRKRRKELKKLKGQAGDLWDDQRELLEHANRVAREARRQASHYAREEVSPRIRDKYDDTLRPVVDTARAAAETGLSTARSAASHTRHRISDDVIPGVTSALGAALAAIEVAKNHQVQDAMNRAAKFGNDVGTRVGIVKPKPSVGPGKYILIGFGVVAFAVVAYAAWQTLRADDDLWVEETAIETPLANES
ncbi:hypothetical protein GCM10007382_24510 [Salinibacterium xinjiangense]|uniref:DNA helicase n=1 Tax=Salinibacterium xinjiangense TaxID=386302 RepID=A0A2C9A0R4_9MICO|nr:hypothetical protein [Salinibacterium xinjiangense]GGL03757.1 hypothetical protein GCM10007382_24510 [Salinibacterium xinjiangense]SOE72520.1 hypothetical protein SAMN06296378_2526 [Salinibacterium xinjiangense]